MRKTKRKEFFTDIYLDGVTNVKEIFPNRNHTDGFHYVRNFTLDELRMLKVRERVNPLTNVQKFPTRFPSTSKTLFQLATLNETIELILGLNRATNRRRELLIEIKKPEYHFQTNKIISQIVLQTLNDYNLTRSTDPIILQTFYIEELFRMRQSGTQLRLFALITSNLMNESSTNYDVYLTEKGLKELSNIVQGIAPDYQLVVQFDQNGMIISPTNLTELAHRYNLLVYPYTFRQDLFLGGNFTTLIEYFWKTVQIDGFITDHPDVVWNLLQTQKSVSTARCHEFSVSLLYFSSITFAMTFFSLNK